MLTDEKQQQIELYGQLLTGDETELDLAKLARIQYLKTKMRPRLAAQIGDYGDNITDVTRALVLGEAIRIGIVTDIDTITLYNQYIDFMLQAYGGAEAILKVLGENANSLSNHLVNGYYSAKQQIMAVTEDDEDSITAINSVDLE